MNLNSIGELSLFLKWRRIEGRGSNIHIVLKLETTWLFKEKKINLQSQASLQITILVKAVIVFTRLPWCWSCLYGLEINDDQRIYVQVLS